MKTRSHILIFLLSVFVLAGCQAGNGRAEAQSLTPTGYPSDEVQWPCLCFRETLYIYDANGFDLPLPEGYEEAGAVETMDNRVYPTEDFCSARVEPGTKFYASDADPDTIYVGYEKGYGKFCAEKTKTEQETTGS